MENNPMPRITGTDGDRSSANPERLLRIDAPAPMAAKKTAASTQKASGPRKARTEPDEGRRLLDQIRKEADEAGLLDYDTNNPFK